jgi:hypothetical protein
LYIHGESRNGERGVLSKCGYYSESHKENQTRVKAINYPVLINARDIGCPRGFLKPLMTLTFKVQHFVSSHYKDQLRITHFSLIISLNKFFDIKNSVSAARTGCLRMAT